jgi:hypothetical protein
MGKEPLTDADSGADWLAARFVLDELDEGELEQCERLLETDPSFAERVAQAAELLDAVARAERTTLAAPRRGWRGWRETAVGAGLGAAAAVAAGAAVWSAGLLHLGGRPAEAALGKSESNSPVDPVLATHWFENDWAAALEMVGGDAAATPSGTAAEAVEADSEEPIAEWLVAVASLPPVEAEGAEAPDDGS